MGKIIRIDGEGHLIYDGVLSSVEKANVDQILVTLKSEIPDVEKTLANKFGKGVLYKYNLGLFLGGLLDKYEIPYIDRRKFWDEIKYLASDEKRNRDEGKNAATRSFYQQCYELSKLPQETVEKLSWRQWQDLLDRVDNRSDERLYEWIRTYPNKITELEWRSFEKALHLYLKGKDTSVFDNEELFEIYTSLIDMCKEWHVNFNLFARDNPKSLKIKNKSNWENKFYSQCFSFKKEKHSKIVTKDICTCAFDILFNK